MHGQFVWYELQTTDSAAAQRFYPAVTGWGIQKWDAADDYLMWTAGGVPFAGLAQITPAQRAQAITTNWHTYVSVDNVDAAATKATSLGGKIMTPPEDVPGTGRFAMIQDPLGASIAIFTSNNPGPGFDGTPTLGHFSWHELATSDYKAAFAFYSRMFGWQKTSEMDMGGSTYLMFGMKGKPFGGMSTRQAGSSLPPSWLYYVNVRDAKSATASIARGGGKVMQGPMQVPGGDWIAAATDPQGTMFAVHQTAAEAAAGTAATPAKKAKPKAKVMPKQKTKAKKKVTARAKPKAKAKKKAEAKRKSGRR